MKRLRNNQSEMTPKDSTFHFTPEHTRRILCVFPKYAWSFGTFNYSFPLMGIVKAFMPPQGILLIAALVPARWEIRFIDENIRPATEDDLRWADAVFTTGMHIQREQIRDVIGRAHRAGRSAILGGPSASSAPEWYPEADIIHFGEVGDATFKLFELIDRNPGRPPQQIMLRTSRTPANDRVSHTSLSPDQCPRLPPLHGAVLQRLPSWVRVLRHPGSLRSPSPP